MDAVVRRKPAMATRVRDFGDSREVRFDNPRKRWWIAFAHGDE
jgi:hypothetical protein